MYSTKLKEMRSSPIRLVLVGLAMMLATGAPADEISALSTPPAENRSLTGSGGSVLPEESLKVSLLEWIGENSEYDVSGSIASPPRVAFCKHGSTLIYEGKAIHFDDRLNGVYDQQTKQICLARPWRAASTKDQGVLLHELVHHVQFENRKWTCPKATERQAYRLQEAWLLENGYRPDFNWVYVIMTSSCTPRDVHP